MTIYHFNDTINIWIKALEQYSFNQLIAKPSEESWSIGQVYVHLAGDTRFYLEQIVPCLIRDEHADEEATPEGKAMLAKNDFPDERLRNPANAFMPQPESKDRIMHDMLALKADANVLAYKMSKTTFAGKTLHPGLGYFSAQDWLQFADMHLRHHLRQKKRIDRFLAEQIQISN
jgi:hypothetical protein